MTKFCYFYLPIFKSYPVCNLLFYLLVGLRHVADSHRSCQKKTSNAF